MTPDRIAVIGLGFVGLTSAVVFADLGAKVYGVNRNIQKNKAIQMGDPGFFEPNLTPLLKKVLKKGSLTATTDLALAVKKSCIIFICVNTPSSESGAIDLSYVRDVALDIGKAVKPSDGYKIIVVKSTVVPGTTEKVVRPILAKAAGKRSRKELGVAANPEFLREGSAVYDSYHPDRIVIGGDDSKAISFLEKFYEKMYPKNTPPIIKASTATGEMIKYASNAFLATKISYINTLANIATRIQGVDIEVVANAMGLDHRIGKLFLKAGPGYGGSCFPKDVKALIGFGRDIGYRANVLESVDRLNERQPFEVLRLAQNLVGPINNKHFSILGLAFKKDTDDIRSAVSVKIIEYLLSEGAKVTVYDPLSMNNVRSKFGSKIEYGDTPQKCLKDSDCCLVLTEWDIFRKLKPKDFIKHMRNPAVVDARRIFNPEDFIGKTMFSAIGLGSTSEDVEEVRKTRSETWENPALAVNAIVKTGKDELVIVKRSNHPFQDYWSLPGGFVEYGETVEQSLKREVKEETGLKTNPGKIVGVYSDPKRNPEKHVISILMETKLVSGVLRKGSSEISDVKTVSKKSLPKKMAFDHLKMLKDYLRK